jgi:hypothetical protein
VLEELEASGAEADIYVMEEQDFEDKRVLKYYRRGICSKAEITEMLAGLDKEHGVQVYETGAKDGRGRGRRNDSFDAPSEACSTSIFENGSKVEFRGNSEAEKVGLNSGSTYYREEGPKGPTRRSSLRCSPRCRSVQLDCHATLWLAMTGREVVWGRLALLELLGELG